MTFLVMTEKMMTDFISKEIPLVKISVPDSRCSDQGGTGHSSTELLRDCHLHKLLTPRDHDIHLAALAGDDVDTQAVAAQEHLASVCLLH